MTARRDEFLGVGGWTANAVTGSILKHLLRLSSAAFERRGALAVTAKGKAHLLTPTARIESG